jgi:hypothetical protein
VGLVREPDVSVLRELSGYEVLRFVLKRFLAVCSKEVLSGLF